MVAALRETTRDRLHDPLRPCVTGHELVEGVSKRPPSEVFGRLAPRDVSDCSARDAAAQPPTVMRPPTQGWRRSIHAPARRNRSAKFTPISWSSTNHRARESMRWLTSMSGNADCCKSPRDSQTCRIRQVTKGCVRVFDQQHDARLAAEGYSGAVFWIRAWGWMRIR